MPHEIMDIQDLGRYLKLAPVTLYKMVSEGKIPHRRIGKSLRFPKSMIDQWLAQPTPAELPVNIQKAVTNFSSQIKKKLGQRLKEIRLYGSWARQEGRLDSDIDIALIVDHKDIHLLRDVSDIASDISLQTDTMVSTLILEEETHQAGLQKGYPLHQKIKQEGIPL